MKRYTAVLFAVAIVASLWGLTYTAAHIATAHAAPPTDTSVTAPDSVWNGTTTASVQNEQPPPQTATSNYVLAQCFNAQDTLIWGGYFSIQASQAQVGPFYAQTTWSTPTPAHCTAEVGYFRRHGFGKWVAVASTEFNVAAA